ncbi:MAG: GNAT family N-acetyltransferase [Clostridia bacterium]|nr:GNAT family N-acetyltransferase [Clostridia bacterium]
MLTIRLASPTDAEALVHLNAAFNEVDDITPDDVCRSLLTSSEIVAIAKIDGETAGFCCAQVHHSFCYKTPVAELTEMYVSPIHRRKGCAAGMLRFLEGHLRSEYGVDEIHLLTGTHNFAAQAAYQQAGFTLHNEAYMAKEVSPTR